MWALRIRPSRMRQRLLVLVAAVNAGLAGYVLWLALQHYWLDYLWCWPLLIVAALLTLHGVTATPFAPAVTLWLSESGQGHYSTNAWQTLVLQQGLLTPFVACIRFALPENDPLQLQHKPQARQRLGHWQWLYMDQLSDADWARLRRVCLNVRARSAST